MSYALPVRYAEDIEQISVKSKISKIDLFIFIFILANLFIIRYFKPIYPMFNIFNFTVIDMSVTFYVLMRVMNLNIRVKTVAIFIALWILALVISINLSKYGLNSIAVENIMMVLSPATLIVFLIYLRKVYSPECLHKLAFQIKRFLNVYFILNSAIIIIQISTGSFLMTPFFKINPHAFDHMDGLIGSNGVSVLNFVWIATILFNLYSFIIKRKITTIITIVFQICLMSLISTFNDNKMFLITLFSFLLIFVVLVVLSSDFTIKTILKLAAGLLVAFLFLNAASGSLDSGFAAKYKESKDLTEQFTSTESTVDKDNERAYLNYLAFHQYDAYQDGIGLAKVNMKNQTIHKHLGINSSSLLLIQGGLIYLIAVIHFFSVLLLRLFVESSVIKKIMIHMSLASTLAVSSYATQIFKDHYVFIAFLLIYFALYLTYNRSSYIRDMKKVRMG